MSIEISYKDAVLTSGRIFKNNIKFIFIVSIIYTILLQSISQGKLDAIGLLPGGSIITSALTTAFSGRPEVLQVVVGIIGIALMIVMQMGLISISLGLIDGNRPRFSQLYDKDSPLIKEYPKLKNYIILSIIYGIAVVIGFILLVIPGIYLWVKYMFSSYLVIDKNMKPLNALKKSSEMTRRIKLRLIGFILVFGICAIPLTIILLLIEVGILYGTFTSRLDLNQASMVLTFVSTFMTFPFTLYMGIIYRSALKVTPSSTGTDIQGSSQLLEETKDKSSIPDTVEEKKAVEEESDADAYDT